METIKIDNKTVKLDTADVEVSRIWLHKAEAVDGSTAVGTFVRLVNVDNI